MGHVCRGEARFTERRSHSAGAARFAVLVYIISRDCCAGDARGGAASQAPYMPPIDDLGVDTAAAWAQPANAVRCAADQTLPLTAAVPHALLSVLWRCKRFLPPREFESVCDSLARFWHDNAARAMPALKACAGPAWNASAFSAQGGQEPEARLLAQSIEAFGAVLQALAACVSAVRRVCREAAAPEVRARFERPIGFGRSMGHAREFGHVSGCKTPQPARCGG